jgi:hypothetical protein
MSFAAECGPLNRHSQAQSPLRKVRAPRDSGRQVRTADDETDFRAGMQRGAGDVFPRERLEDVRGSTAPVVAAALEP